MKNFKLGLDIHGVIDHDPEFFSILTHILKLHPEIEVHVITGGVASVEKKNLKDWNIEYDKFFSIQDYLTYKQEPVITYDKLGNPSFDDEAWDKTKGDYCREVGITIMIDDTLRYADHMPDTTHFYHYVR